ncbi:MAG: universal stress protein [Terracidiphilus sp.]
MASSGDVSSFLPATIVFATDFSECSENAGRFASLLAKEFDAELLVAHAFELTESGMDAEARGGPGFKCDQRRDLEAALRGADARFCDGAKCITPILLEGDPKMRIPELARLRAPSYIVLGTQGRSRIGRGLLGSVAEEILRSAASPTLTVGPQVPFFEHQRPLFQRILLATGLSPAAARAVQHAVAVATAFHAEMDVLHVIHPEDEEDENRMRAIREQFDSIVGTILPAHADALRRPRASVKVGDAREQILRYLRESSADLLVLGVRKTSHLWLESRRSGAFQIVAEAPCPVMTIVR